MKVGWSERRVGEFATRKKVINELGEDLPPLSVTKDRGVLLQSEKYNKRVATDPRKYVVVEDGDFAFDPMSLYYGALGRVGRVGRGLISPDYVAFTADSTVDPTFLEYKLRSRQMIRVYERVAQAGNQFGKRRRVYWSVLADLPVLLPPLPEQREIAATLKAADDAMTTGGAVAEQLDRVGGRLAEELLRRGLPGRHAHFIPTPLGRLPAGWRTVGMDEVLVGIDAGWSPACDSDPAADDEWGVLKVSCASWGRFLPEENKRLPMSLAPRPELAVRPGDLIMSRANTKDLVGRAVVVESTPPRLMLCDKLLRLRVNIGFVLPGFINIALGSANAREQIENAATGSSKSMKNISQEAIRQILVPLPPLDEQQSIVEAIAAVADRVDKERAVLAERRRVKAALADALLSGRLRVREAA